MRIEDVYHARGGKVECAGGDRVWGSEEGVEVGCGTEADEEEVADLRVRRAKLASVSASSAAFARGMEGE